MEQILYILPMINGDDDLYSMAKDMKKKEREKEEAKDWDKINLLDKFITMR